MVPVLLRGAQGNDAAIRRLDRVSVSSAPIRAPRRRQRDCADGRGARSSAGARGLRRRRGRRRLGATASVAGTAGYQHLLAAARTRSFDAIIVESQDRLWRNQAEMHAALRRLQFWGIKVFSVATRTDLTDKAGRLIA